MGTGASSMIDRADDATVKRVAEALAPYLSARCSMCAGTGADIRSNLDCSGCNATGIRREFERFAREAASAAILAALADGPSLEERIGDQEWEDD